MCGELKSSQWISFFEISMIIHIIFSTTLKTQMKINDIFHVDSRHRLRKMLNIDDDVNKAQNLIKLPLLLL